MHSIDSAITAVTPVVMAEYDRNGVVCLRNVTSRGWRDRLAEAVDEAWQRPGPHAESHGDASPPLFFGVSTCGRAYSTRWLGDNARCCQRLGEVAISTFKTNLQHGDPFDGPMFPLVYTDR